MNNVTHTDTSLKKKQRLGKRRDFEKVFQGGRVFSAKNLRAYVLPNSLGFPRLGIVTGRKVGKAVTRNRIKRLLRECFRLNRPLIEPGLDVVLVVRKGFPTTYREVEEEFRRLVNRFNTRKAAK